MACGVTAINQVSDPTACGGVGGITKSWGIPCSDISDITIGDDGNGNSEISAITLASTKAFAKLVPDDDKTAFFNQEGTRDGKKLTIEQNAFLKFNTVNEAKIQAANDAAECCCTVWIHEFTNGIRLMQGVDETASGWDFTTVTPLVTPNVLSDTAENEDRVEYNISSESRKYALPVDNTIDLDTLVGS